MAVPSNRVPVRVARGLKSALAANLADLLEGELVYAKDEDQLYMVEGGALVAMGADLAASSIGDLSDVALVAPATGEVLRYDGSNWVDAQLDYADLANTPTLATVATSGDYNDLSNLPTLGTAAAANTGDFATAAQGALADSAVQPTDSIDVLADVDTTTAAPTTGQVLEWNGTNWVPADAAGGAVDSVNGKTGVVVLDLENLDNVSLVPDPAAQSFNLSGPASSNPSASGEWGLDTGLNNYFTWFTSDPIDAWIGTLSVGESVEFVTQGGYTHVGVITQAATVNGPNSDYISFANDPWPQELLNADANNEPITVQEVGGGLLPPTDGQVLTWVNTNSRWEPADAAGGGLSGVGVATRATDSGTAASGALTLTGLGSSGLLHTISTDLDAWVVFYGSAADRTADAGRAYNTDPTAGSGVLAEAYVTTAGAVLFTPGTMYLNNDTTETSAVYLAVRDQAGAAVNATLTVSAYIQGGYTGVSGGTFGSG